MSDRAVHTTPSKAEAWEILQPLLVAMYEEFSDLSKKKPDGALNSQKIAMVNRLLVKCLEVLASEPAKEFLDLIEPEAIPQNSDVVLLLSQYVAAMKSFRGRYYGYRASLDDEAWATSKGR